MDSKRDPRKDPRPGDVFRAAEYLRARKVLKVENEVVTWERVDGPNAGDLYETPSHVFSMYMQTMNAEVLHVAE